MEKRGGNEKIVIERVRGNIDSDCQKSRKQIAGFEVHATPQVYCTTDEEF